jgi:phage terminase small subunit
MAKQTPTTPGHLADPGKSFWESTQQTYGITDSHGLKLLTLAAESLMVAEDARKALALHGQTFVDRFGQPRARPEIAIARNAMIAFERLTKELRLDPAPETHR